jgi:hypothetical protein
MMAAPVSLVITAEASPALMQAFIDSVEAYARRQGRQVELVIVNDMGVDLSAMGRHDIEGVTLQICASLPSVGQLPAIVRGISCASHDIIVTMDPDMYGNVDDIESLIASHNAGMDFVNAWRLGRQDTRLVRRVLSGAFNALLRGMRVSGLRDINSPMTLLSRPAANAVVAAFPACGSPKLYLCHLFAQSSCEVGITVRKGLKEGSNYSLPMLARLVCLQLGAIYRCLRYVHAGAAPDNRPPPQKP